MSKNTYTELVLKIDGLPPAEREVAAEKWLRRPGVPGPAAEHAIQHLLGVWEEFSQDSQDEDVEAVATRHRAESRTAIITKGADAFYAAQYRQYLNPTMGAFAATATHALIGTGTPPPTLRADRLVRAAMVTGRPTCPPILVLDHQSVAVAILIPRSLSASDDGALWHWLTQNGVVPDIIRFCIEGRTIHSRRPGARAIERSNMASVMEVIEGALGTRRLAILALHPTDPDAMGLHITLFGVVGRDAPTLAKEHGLPAEVLAPMVDAAAAEDSDIFFLVGGTEEVFTQCSQNLFVKRQPRVGDAPARTAGWRPSDPLIELIGAQFELFQVTASSAGLPGASPRNGATGSVAYVVGAERNDLLMIPYHPGNFIHGHAAKLWSNPYGAIVVRDEHHHQRQVVLRGPCRVISPEDARIEYPDVIAMEVARSMASSRKQQPAYWFSQMVSEVIIETDLLPPMVLDESRPSCSLSAAGRGKFGKKPAYFDAQNTTAYDQALQHRREAAGRPTDASGAEHRRWASESANAMAARVAHLSIASGMVEYFDQH
ncbi:MAG: hypothetical protein RLZZ403_88 [Pseudomonadota bacterium]